MRYLLFSLLFLAACARMDQVGRAPDFSPLEGSYQHHAMYSTPMQENVEPDGPTDASSLWTAGRSSLFGDRRATRSGDILTVVIEIDDSAEIKNTSGRSRSGSDKMAIGSLFGVPERLTRDMPAGSSLDSAVDTSSA